MTQLILKDVSKSYEVKGEPPVKVIDRLSLQVESGGIVYLDGPSGSGKSTLLNLVAGLHRPDEGEILVGETKIHRLSEAKRDRFRAMHMGYIFQTFNLLSPLTALENLVLPSRLTGTKPMITERDALDQLERLGLKDHAKKRPHELSVGQRQRVAVARAVLKKPSVLLADEPSANLDEESCEMVMGAIRELNEAGTTLVLASHDPHLKATFAGVHIDVRTGEVSS